MAVFGPFIRPRLRHLQDTVTIKSVAETRNDDGSLTFTASGTDTRKARIVSRGGDEYEVTDSRKAIGEIEIVFRYYSGLTNKHRIVFGSTTYEIVAIDNWLQRNQWHRVACKESS